MKNHLHVLVQCITHLLGLSRRLKEHGRVVLTEAVHFALTRVEVTCRARRQRQGVLVKERLEHRMRSLQRLVDA